MSDYAEIDKVEFVEFVDLAGIEVPRSVIELMPESLAREHTILPLLEEEGILMLLVANPTDLQVMEKLQFRLKKTICPVLARREQILVAIDRHYQPNKG